MTRERTITLAQGIALYMGAVLGSGILILPGYTADVAGPAAVVSWIIMSLLSIPIAYTFARLALKYNHFGGISTIVQHAFGTYWSAIVGWFFYVWVATGQAVVGLTGAAYIARAMHLSDAYLYLFAFLFLLAAVLTNFLGMRISGQGIFVYIIASLACVKLLWHDAIGRFSALLALVCCLVVAPFALGFLVIPVGVALVCIIYLRYRTRNATSMGVDEG